MGIDARNKDMEECSMTLENRLANRKAIVTGGARGMGFAMAKRLHDEGAKVAVLDVNEAQAKEAAKELDGIGLYCDVSSVASCKTAVKAAAEALGGIDILVNLAGIIHQQSIEETTEEAWDKVMAVNTKGVFFMCQQCVPYLKESAAPRIINISSVAGRMGGFETGLAYSASKGAVNALTYGLARQLSPWKITVNAVCPGTTLTPMAREGFTKEQMDRLMPRFLLGRLGEPEDQAAAVAFLASDDAAWITGLLLDVNGGMYMG